MLPVVIAITGFVVLLVLAAKITNPFSRLSVVRRLYVVRREGSKLQATNALHRMCARNNFIWRQLAVVKSLVHILESRYVSSPGTARTTDVNQIIKAIRAHRFKPNKLLLTSGDHFSALYVRNLGVFYYPTLDAQLPDTQAGWLARQQVYLQTVAFALGYFRQSPVPVTTIMTMGPHAATGINWHAYPSDTVYGILYALAALQGQEPGFVPAEHYGPTDHILATKQLAKELQAEYADTLTTLYEHYRQTVFNEKTGLLSTNVHISGAKDITRRESSFYDNVVFWKTTQLAMQAGLIPQDKAFLDKLKRKIIKTFWLEKEGYFLEDLSEEGKAGKYYSSDWLIVLVTGFLRPSDAKERAYYEGSVRYIQEQGIDQPFAIKYQQETRAHRQFFLVRLAVASYGGDAIWSFWGMEYCKVLLLLYKYTGNPAYRAVADYNIKAYESNMVRDRGYPEIYDPQGNMLQTPLYRSIRQTGWVIGFEQLRALRKSLSKRARR